MNFFQSVNEQELRDQRKWWVCSSSVRSSELPQKPVAPLNGSDVTVVSPESGSDIFSKLRKGYLFGFRERKFTKAEEVICRSLCRARRIPARSPTILLWNEEGMVMQIGHFEAERTFEIFRKKGEGTGKGLENAVSGVKC
nr:hypothetical protein Iba_chr02cCG8970 [Ipomoea batatas]